MAEWVRSLIFSTKYFDHLIAVTGVGPHWPRQAMFCLRVCPVVFPEYEYDPKYEEGS